MHEIVGDRILYLIGVSSYLQFCPNFRLVSKKGSRTISFLIQVPRMTSDRTGTCERPSKLWKNSEHIFCVPFSPPCNVIFHWHEDDSALTCSGSHCIPFINFESLRECQKKWLLEYFPLELRLHAVDAIQFLEVIVLRIPFNFILQAAFGSFRISPHKALSRRRCTL